MNVLVLHKKLLVPVLIYESKAMLWKEKERSRIRAIQMDNLRGLLDRRIVRVPNARIREFFGVMKGVDERIDGVLQWLGHVKKMTGLLKEYVIVCW